MAFQIVNNTILVATRPPPPRRSAAAPPLPTTADIPPQHHRRRVLAVQRLRARRSPWGTQERAPNNMGSWSNSGEATFRWRRTSKSEDVRVFQEVDAVTRRVGKAETQHEESEKHTHCILRSMLSKSSQALRACREGGSAASRSSTVSRRAQGRRRGGRERGGEKSGSVAPSKRKGGIEGRRGHGGGMASTMENTVLATGRAVSRKEKATSRRWWWYENKRHFELRHTFPRCLSGDRDRHVIDFEKIYGSPNALKL
ncbi:hypothetical protein B0H11DRAFT_2308521 [Mycena galericulata]|nr:hypothetical protein B0H11DRAFT_2308521 [Mycena galericulata]